MKHKNRILTLLISAAMVILMSAPAFANNNVLESGTCKYNGTTLKANFSSGDLVTRIASLEPGDSLEYTVTYSNDSNDTVDYYMLADTLQTLEDSKSVAENGGYRFVLRDSGPQGETVLFDNSKVGGDKLKTVKLEGLHQATNATQKYFHIHRLKPGEKGTTYLRVEFDEETEANDYMDTAGALRIGYAVEKVSSGKGSQNPAVESHPRTGDTFDLLKYIVIMTLALLVGILAFISWRKDRKDGDEA